MYRTLTAFSLLASSSLFAGQNQFHKFKRTTIERKQIDFSRFRGKTVLVANIASRCGYTPQLKGLQALHKKYAGRNFEVVAFPSNDFNQEPLAGVKIGEFCKKNYGVDFTIFQKTSVRGSGADPVYKYLSTDSGKGDVKWNFEKFLVNGSGKVIARFDSEIKPGSKVITDAIEKSLGGKPS